MKISVILSAAIALTGLLSVEVYADAPGAHVEDHVFNTVVSFVNIDDAGKKRSLTPRGQA